MRTCTRSMAVLAAALVVAACGNEDGGSVTNETAEEQSTQTTTETAGDTSEPEGEPDEAQLSASSDVRKRSVLAETTASKTTSIADAAMLKDLDVIVVSDVAGQVPLEDGHGMGLYHRDCRYLCGYDYLLADSRPQPLAASTHEGARARFKLVNLQMRCRGGTVAQAHQVSMMIDRRLDGVENALIDHVTIHNYGDESLDVPVTIALVARFEDIFAVRGQVAQPDVQHRAPQLEGRVLRFACIGSDGKERRLAVELPAHASIEEEFEHGVRIRLIVHAAARDETAFDLAIRIDDEEDRVDEEDG